MAVIRTGGPFCGKAPRILGYTDLTFRTVDYRRS